MAGPPVRRSDRLPASRRGLLRAEAAGYLFGVDSDGIVASARLVARRRAGDLAAGGAAAVVLVGSVARGDAQETSDIDLVALGDGPEYHLEQSAGWLVSVSWRTAEQIRAALESPEQVGGAVPAWRDSIVLYDPIGVATGLRHAAHSWEWSTVAAACDGWVAREVTGFAEEVHRLVGHHRLGRRRAGAAIRSVLALRLATIMAVHRRLLYGSENRLWDLVAETVGPAWADAQDRALSLASGDGRPGRADGRGPTAGALDLYALLAAEAAPLLDAAQTAVVERALELARSVG